MHIKTMSNTFGLPRHVTAHEISSSWTTYATDVSMEGILDYTLLSLGPFCSLLNLRDYHKQNAGVTSTNLFVRSLCHICSETRLINHLGMVAVQRQHRVNDSWFLQKWKFTIRNHFGQTHSL